MGSWKTIGKNTIVYNPDKSNIYDATIGDYCKVATFVEIQRDVVIGSYCKIEAFVFIPTGVTIGDGVFIGPHTCFTNDKNPRAVGEDGKLLGLGEWTITPTIIKDRAVIGANVTIVCGVTIGESAIIGAGSVVTKDVPSGELWVGNPAQKVEK